MLSAALLITQGCSWFKKMPENAPEYMREKKLVEEIKNAQNTFNKVRLSGKAQFKSPKMSQSFRFEIRMLQDSVVWLNIGDPFLGLNVARAVAYPGSVSFYNKLSKEYFEGDADLVREKLGFAANFEMLAATFAGNLVVPVGKNAHLEFLPGQYYLTDKPQSEESGNLSKTVFHEYYVNPQNFKATVQKRLEPAAGKEVVLTYKNFKEVEGQQWPHSIEFEYRGADYTQVKFDIRDIETNGNFGFPFSIPGRYAPM